jgi:PAS domain S-box-containing protein
MIRLSVAALPPEAFEPPESGKGDRLPELLGRWNTGVTRLYRYTEAEAIGRPTSLMFPPDRPAELQEIRAQLAQGRDVRYLETVQRHKDGRDLDVLLTVALIRDATGAVVGSASVTGRRIYTEQVLVSLLDNAAKYGAEGSGARAGVEQRTGEITRH